MRYCGGLIVNYASFTTKNRVRGILDQIESNLRSFIVNDFQTSIGSGWWDAENIPDPIIKKCRAWKQQHERDPFRLGEIKEEYNYMSFGHLLRIITKNSDRFPAFTPEVIVHLKQLEKLRDATSHPTDIPTVDIESCRIPIRGIIQQSFMQSTPDMGRLLLQEFEEAITVIRTIPIDNLPSSPFGDFVGREEALESIRRDLLSHPNSWLILIDGIGGIGKSSLAYKIAQEIRDEIVDGISEFQHIIWLSAKNRKLSYKFDVEDLEPDFDSLEPFLDRLISFFGIEIRLDLTIDEKRQLVYDAMAITKSLLIVDNLETVDDITIYTFLDRIPNHNKAILTSRDRRYKSLEGKGLPLEGLSIEEAVQLIKARISQNNIQSLINADDTLLEKIAHHAFGHPLILDCLLSQIYYGKPVEFALNELGQAGLDNVFEYCFGAAYSLLSDFERQILMCVVLFEENVGFKELLFVTNRDNNEIAMAIENLRRFSLIKEDASSGISEFYMLPVIKHYVEMQMVQRPALASEIMQRHSLYKAELIRLDALTLNDPVLKNFKLEDTFDKFAARIASDALTRYNQTGDYHTVVSDLNAALRLSPESSYVCQIRAFVERSEQSFGEAAKWYDKATNHDPKNPLLWRYWGDLEKQLRNNIRATDKYRTTLKYAPDDKRAWLSLGICLCGLAKEKFEQNSFSEHDEFRQEAKEAFTNAVYEHPDEKAEYIHNYKTMKNQAWNYWHLQEYPLALESCSKALKINHDDVNLRDLKERAKKRIGK